MKIIITAANGFIGKSLVNYLKTRHEVVALVRKDHDFGAEVKTCIWDGKNSGEWVQELISSDVLINLAGRSVDCRYTLKNKAEIYASRLDSTNILGRMLDAHKHQVKVWINAASATIYRHSFEPMTEWAGQIGTGFSVDVCKRWEQAFFHWKGVVPRQIALRTAIVLGAEGGVMRPFRKLVDWGLGGNMGNGQQRFSWIHQMDLNRAIAFLISEKNCNGVFNLSAPQPSTNERFMELLRRERNKRFGLQLSKWMLEIGAKLIGTETELVMKSRYVIPERLLEAGFHFSYENLEQCLADLEQGNQKRPKANMAGMRLKS